jgi:hypothetical protein
MSKLDNPINTRSKCHTQSVSDEDPAHRRSLFDFDPGHRFHGSLIMEESVSHAKGHNISTVEELRQKSSLLREYEDYFDKTRIVKRKLSQNSP